MNIPAIVMLAFLGAYPLCAGENDTPDELTAKQKARALAFLKSTDGSKRAGAIKAFRGLTDAQRDTYKEVLEKAREHHANDLDKKAFDLSFDDNTLTEFVKVWKTWAAKRDEALGMVLTDWKKDKGKMAEMDAKFAGAETAFGRMLRVAERAGRAELARLTPRVLAIAQIDGELAWCEGESEGTQSPAELKAVLRSIDAGEKLIALLRDLEDVRRAQSERAAVGNANESLDSAIPSQKAFAKILNDRRLVLGLQLLRLDTQLSAACLGHSTEMGQLGYFDHTSPTEKNRSFGKRAKNAGFKGSPSGECIYSGGGGAVGAHKAWWYSDGHRLIMYARNPNTLGIASAGSLWTLNTGRKKR